MARDTYHNEKQARADVIALADRLIAAHGNNREAAAELHRRAAADPALRDALTRPLLRRAAEDLIAQRAGIKRRAIMEAVSEEIGRGDASGQAIANPHESAMGFAPAEYQRPSGPDARIALLNRAVTEALMDAPLSDGTPLGDANRDLLLRDAARNRKVGQTYLRTGGFYERIAERLAPDQVVRDVLDEPGLRAVMREAEHA